MNQETNTFKIVAVHSGKVLDAYAFGATQDTPIVQHEYLGGDNQHWIVSTGGRNGYELRAVHSGLALMGAEDAINGSPVYQSPIHSDYVWERWSIEPIEGHPDIFLIRYLANNKVLDVWLKGLENGARVVLHDYLGGDNQHWQFVLVSR